MNFQSNSLKVFLDSHTRLNNYVKVAVAAVDFLYNSTQDKDELSKRINTLILAAGERWTPRVINAPQEELTTLRNDLAKSGIVWVYSAFDVFFKQVEGYLSNSFDVKNSKMPNRNGEEEEEEKESEDKVSKFYKKLKWPLDNIKDILPVFNFYKKLRNCIAHNMGYATEGLIAHSKDKNFEEAINNWKTKFKKKTISLPPFVTGNQICIKPHHAIMYSETCLRIAKDINEKLFKELGLNDFIFKTIKKHLVDINSLTKPYCLNYEKYLIFHLKNDYNISAKYADIANYYTNNNDKNQHSQRYATLKLLKN